MNPVRPTRKVLPICRLGKVRNATRYWSLIALLLLTCHCWGTLTIAQVQIVTTSARCGPTSGTTCTLTINPTGINALGVSNVGVLFVNSNVANSAAIRVSGGGVWSKSVLCSGTGGSPYTSSCFTNLSMQAGTTTITTTMQRSNTVGSVIFYEISFSGVMVDFDGGVVTALVSTASPPYTAAAPMCAIGGLNDVILENVYTGGDTPLGLAGGYSLDVTQPGTAAGSIENVSTCQIPTWSFDQQVNGVASAIALKEQYPFFGGPAQQALPPVVY